MRKFFEASRFAVIVDLGVHEELRHVDNLVADTGDGQLGDFRAAARVNDSPAALGSRALCRKRMIFLDDCNSMSTRIAQQIFQRLREAAHLKPLNASPYDAGRILTVRASSQFRVTLDTNHRCKTQKRGHKPLFDPTIFEKRCRTIEHIFAWEDKFRRLLLLRYASVTCTTRSKFLLIR